MIPRRPSSAILAAGLVIATAAWAALAPPRAAATGVTVAVAVPDSARLAGLREVVAGAHTLKVVGESGTERIPDPILDSSGVRSAGWQPVASRRAALFTAERTAPVAARSPIPWGQIARLEIGRSKTLRGAVGGTVIGLVVGSWIALKSHPRGYASESDAYRSIGIVSGTTVAGTLLGALIGSQSGFRPIYHADTGFEALRLAYAPPRPPRRATRLAARLGAALAWDLADLPRHRARLPEPIGGFAAGAAFGPVVMHATPGHESEGAIGALLTRWNTLYPPYALEGMNDH